MEEKGGARSRRPAPLRARNDREEEEEEGCKENLPPPSSSSESLEQLRAESASRAKAGILQAAKNVPFVPLEIQEKILDDDQKRREEELSEHQQEGEEQQTPRSSSFEQMPPPPPALRPIPKALSSNADQTMAMPSEEAFEQMAKCMSTPYHGRRQAEEDNEDDEEEVLDEFTCAVKIVSKKRNTIEHDSLKKTVEQGREEASEKNATPAKEEDPNAASGQAAAAAGGPDYNYALSPIMETSREHNYKSSSSSGHSISHQLTKSHWGNTHLYPPSTAGPKASVSKLDPRTPGPAEAMMRPEITCSSGKFK